MPTVDIGHRDPDKLRSIGPTIEVRIGFDFNFYSDTPPTVPSLSPARYTALLDTGASDSCIHSPLATHLGLPIVGRGEMSGANGKYPVDVYEAQILIPSLNGLVLSRTFPGVITPDDGLWFQALLGRDFLQDYLLTYNGKTGRVKLRSSRFR